MTSLSFLLDENLGLKVSEEPVASMLRSLGVVTKSSTDLVQIDKDVASHEPDIAYIPIASYHRLVGKGDQHYRAIAQAMSKFTGQAQQRSLLVVGKDDPAKSLDDLKGAKFGYINKSCSSSYFPPAILLERKGIKLDDFLQMTPVKPGPTWQGLVDAVVFKEVRATMVLEDVWKTQPVNETTTQVIETYTGGLQGVIVVRESLDKRVRETFLDALLRWAPAWDAVYGPFKPFYDADVHAYFHDLDQLSNDL